MRVRISILLGFFGGLCACGSSAGLSSGAGAYSSESGGSGGAGSGGTHGDGVAAAGGGSSAGDSASNGGAGQGSGGQPGVLTSGIWDDNLNYSFFTSYLQSHRGQNAIQGDPGFAQADYDASNLMFAQRSSYTNIDAALVIDTTGSMEDEITYLTAEFANIAGTIQSAYPNATQRWALIVYRDTQDTDPDDDYVVKTYDFSDPATFSDNIASQYAANGGDYPESPERGLEQLKTLSWSTDVSTAKIAFWVADAPQHGYRAADMKQAISDTLAAGIHVYPVSASGTDELLELTMRSAAQLTGGRYLFLTDDSGVGDPHKAPEIPCYYVTRLAKALERVATMEISGTYIPPAPADIIRTDGDPNAAGTCMTSDDVAVRIF